MNMLLLTELRAIMALLNALPRVPAPAPVLPVSLDLPEVVSLDYPHVEERLKKWLIEALEDDDIPCPKPLYDYYMENRLYPRLLVAAQHYLSWLRTRDDEATNVLLNNSSLDLRWIDNFIENDPLPDDVSADRLYDMGWQSDIVDAVLDRIYGLVESVFNYDLLDVHQIAFDYGRRLRLYDDTKGSWVITPLGQTVQHLSDAEAITFLLVLETMRAMLDQNEWFASRRRLQWLLDEGPLYFDLYAEAEESPIAGELKRDDGWLRRLRWLGIVTYTHRYGPSDFPEISGFNERLVDLTPGGREITDAILASWNNEPERPSILSLVDDVQTLESASRTQATAVIQEIVDAVRRIVESVEGIEEKIDGLDEKINGLQAMIVDWQVQFDEVRQSFEQKLSALEGTALRDQAYQQAYEDLHQLVVRLLPQIDDQIREYERQLAKQLRETWDQLRAESQRFLATAEYLYSQNRGSVEFDFAPAAVEYCKVVETEVVERVFRPLMRYLREKRDLKKVSLMVGDYPKNLNTAPEVKPLSLGQVAYLLEASSNPAEQNQVVRDFLESFYSTKVQDFILGELPDRLKKITTEYRNGSAHTQPLSQKKLEDFRAMLFGSENDSGFLLHHIVLIHPTT